MDTGTSLSELGLVRLLDHTGQRLEHATYSPYAANLTPADLRGFWRAMTLTRAFDKEAESLQRQGELGLWVQSLGQEGAQVGSGAVLRGDDFAFPSYREHAVAFQRGVDLPQMLKIFRGIRHGAWNPQDHNFHLYTLVIGAHALHATGYAMAQDWDGLVGSGNPEQDAATICYFGDGATSQGDVNEALVFAAVNNAPVVFFCQNNQWAISEPTTRQSRVPLADRGKGVGMPTVRVDGNDAIASYAVTNWAMQHARAGNGPVFIEAYTYRMGAHTTSDDPTRYRDRAQEQYWAERDPIVRLATHLTAIGELPDDVVAHVDEEAKDLARRTRDEVRSWAEPTAASLFDNVYAEPHATVEAERAWFSRYSESFVEAHA